MASYVMGETAVEEEDTWSVQEDVHGCCCKQEEVEMEELPSITPVVLIPAEQTESTQPGLGELAEEYHVVQAVAADGSGRTVLVALP